jgi:hypothetical protein
VIISPKVIRDVINVHMEELSNHWQEEQEKADDAKKYVILIDETISFILLFVHSFICFCSAGAKTQGPV